VASTTFDLSGSAEVVTTLLLPGSGYKDQNFPLTRDFAASSTCNDLRHLSDWCYAPWHRG
jgi:hypothetical protein